MKATNKPLVILFAKAPQIGSVKTRLSPSLTPAQAAELHRRLVDRLWRQLNSLHAYLDAELHTDLPTGAWPEAAPHRLQTSGDLGARMLFALHSALQNQRPKAMILGSDVYDLPDDHLLSLLHSDADIAFGACPDGGYWGIACRRVHREMFLGVRWSTPHTLADTIRAAQRCGLTTQIGPAWRDIDTPQDLALLPEPFILSLREGTNSENPRV
ncbi:MAG: TIGR04282 family arsenosugar biosynthesis glycosyltransferase [Bryobacteraceae bacterium]|nr:TIGR04282 family arsenosugar biosynthesis glycosyltransferase [Bryobacteraceae bacterium]MDW8378153.1 TIGR04282 family arsenosugar biosynthesis glycosyltransferase [Bryobacterales bacterium]